MEGLKDRVSIRKLKEQSPNRIRKRQGKNINLRKFLTSKSMDKKKKIVDISSISSPNYSRGIISVDKSDTSTASVFKMNKYKD